MSNNVTIVNVNSLQQSYNNLGMGAIPAGITVDAAVAGLEQNLLQKLQSGWPTAWPPYQILQQDKGIMGPWSANIAGTAPSCVAQQITQDFTSWELPVDENTITAMAQQITQEISSNGGITGTFFGRTPIGGSETIYWGVGFATGAVVDNPEELGIIYVFSAQLGFN